jgi:hypothetical protein
LVLSIKENHHRGHEELRGRKTGTKVKRKAQIRIKVVEFYNWLKWQRNAHYS